MQLIVTTAVATVEEGRIDCPLRPSKSGRFERKPGPSLDQSRGDFDVVEGEGSRQSWGSGACVLCAQKGKEPRTYSEREATALSGGGGGKVSRWWSGKRNVMPAPTTDRGKVRLPGNARTEGISSKKGIEHTRARRGRKGKGGAEGL